MMKIIRSAGIAILLTIVSTPAFGDDGSGKRTLTLDECVELGLKSSKKLHAAAMKVDASAARVKEISADRLPVLKLQAGYTRLSETPPFEVQLPFPDIPGLSLPKSFVISPNIYDNYSLRLNLQQPLFTGFRLRAGGEAARWNLKGAEQDRDAERSEFVFAVRTAYWNLYKALEIRKAVDESRARIEAHLVDVRNFHETGLLTKNDVLRAEVRLSQVELARLDAAHAVEMAGVVLNNLMGLPLGTEIDPATRIDAAVAAGRPVSGEENPSGTDLMIEKASNRRHEIKSLDFRVKAGEAGVLAAKSGWYPQVYLAGNYYDMRPNSRLMPAQDKFTSTWDIGISLSLDLWNWGKTARQTQQAKAQLSQAMDALGLLKDAVAVEVRQTLLELSGAEARISLSRRVVVQAEENLRVTDEKFKEGVALNADVLDAENDYLQAKTELTRSLVDHELAKAKLGKVTGE